MTADDDYKLLKVGIGFTNMVERATKGSADLTRKEIKEGKVVGKQEEEDTSASIHANRIVA